MRHSRQMLPSLLLAAVTAGAAGDPLVYVLEKDGVSLLSPRPVPPYVETLEGIGLRVHLAAGANRTRLSWEQLRRYPLLVMADFATLHGGGKAYDEMELADLLDRYLHEGGSILVLGNQQMTHSDEHDEMNRWLQRHGGQWQWATVDDAEHAYLDPPQAPFARPEIIWTTHIAEHPATAGAQTLFLRNFVFYAPYLRPLTVDDTWTVLVRSMPGSTMVDLERQLGGGGIPARLEATRRPGPADLLAVRQVGKGRMAVFAYNPGQAWFDIGKPAQGAISWRTGDGERRSDWLPLLRSLARWLSEPARTAGFPGGAAGKQAFAILPDWGTRQLIDWEKPDLAVADAEVDRLHTVHSSIWKTADWRRLLAGDYRSFKILVGARTALSGGQGTVADWKRAARQAGFDGVAFREEILKLSEEQWNAFVDDCRAANDDEFIALPGQQFQTMDDSRFMRFNAVLPYPLRERLDATGDRVLQQLHFYFDANKTGRPEWQGGLPANVPLAVQGNPAPWWSYRVYGALPVYIYEPGRLLEDNLAAWEQLVERFEFPTPLALHLLDDPSQVAATADLPHLRLIAPDMKALQDDRRWRAHMGLGHPFNTVAYLSDGPEIVAFQALHPYRTTLGSRGVDGTYRYRFHIRARSDLPIVRLELLSDDLPLRVFRPNRQEVFYTVDGLHDRQRPVRLRVVDEGGRQALAASVHVHDKMMYLQWCGDLCNMLGAGIGTAEDGQPASFGVGTHVKLGFGPGPGPGASAADEVDYIPHGTDTSSPGLGLKGTFRLRTATGVLPAPSHDLIPNLSLAHGNREVRIHRQVVEHQADRDYWINPQANGERRIGHTYFSAWGGYFRLEPLAALSLVHDDIDFQRDTGQPAIQWCRGQVTIRQAIETDGQEAMTIDLGQLASNLTPTFHLADTILSAATPGRVARPLARGEWLTFEGPMGHGSLIPLDDRFVIDAEVNRQGGSRLTYGQALGARQLRPGDRLSYSYLILRWPTGMPVDQGLDRRLVALLGLDGGNGYRPVATTGTVAPAGFGFLATAVDGGVALDLPAADLSVRLPLRVSGLERRWSAGVIRPQASAFEPLAPDAEGIVWAAFDPACDAGRLFVGHPVVANHPEAVVQTLQRCDGGWTVVAHNPGDTPLNIALTGTPAGPLAGFAESARLEPGGETRWGVAASPAPQREQ